MPRTTVHDVLCSVILADGDIPLNVHYMMDRNVSLVGSLWFTTQRVLQALLDLSPRGIRMHLGLSRPIYERTSAYGHFGRTPDVDGGFSWEKTDLVDGFVGLSDPAHAINYDSVGIASRSQRRAVTRGGADTGLFARSDTAVAIGAR